MADTTDAYDVPLGRGARRDNRPHAERTEEFAHFAQRRVEADREELPLHDLVDGPGHANE
jgi:hypothetical protein